MIYNPSKTNYGTLRPDESKWKIGILDLKPKDKASETPFPAHNYQALNAFKNQIYKIDYDTVKKIECSKKNADYTVKPNPTIFQKGIKYGDKSIEN